MTYIAVLGNEFSFIDKVSKISCRCCRILELLSYCFINFGVIFAVFRNMESSRNSNKQCALKLLASQAGLCTIKNNLNDSSKEFIFFIHLYMVDRVYLWMLQNFRYYWMVKNCIYRAQICFWAPVIGQLCDRADRASITWQSAEITSHDREFCCRRNL